MSSSLRAHCPSLLSLALFCVVPMLCLPTSASAAGNELIPSADALAQMEDQAVHANPREQAFLYTQLVHGMTQEAGREIADGETQEAANTLKKVSRYAHLIQLNLAHNARRLKDAQELMHNATYRLGQVLHLVSGEDRTVVQETLKQLDQVNDEMLSQVFTH
jgi:hypothetical protein